MTTRSLPLLLALLLAGAWGAGLGLLHWRGNVWFLDRLEGTMTDLRILIRGTVQPPDNVVIVAIDDDMTAREGYPIGRETLSRLIETIAHARPKAIAVDLLLLDPDKPEDDKALARSLGSSPSIIAAAAVFQDREQRIEPGNDGPLERVPKAERFLLPLQIFTDAAPIGVVNITTDQTGSARFAPLLLRSDQSLEASLPLRTAALAIGADPELEGDRLVIGDRTIRTDLGYLLPLSFYGPRGTIATYGAATVLNGGIPADTFLNRIVVIGATVTGGGDVFPTPFDPVLPGVEVISTAIAQIMAGDGLVRDREVRLLDAAIAIILPMILVALIAWRRSTAGLAAILAVLLLWAALNMLAFWRGVWLSAALPVAAAAPPLVLFGAVQIWLDRRRAEELARQRDLLQRIQAPGLGKWLARNRDFLLRPVHEDAAVLFIDLSGFTGLSETLEPDATRELLSDFHRLVDEEVTACSGIVTSFMGDGAMILFGLPAPADLDAANATRCGVRLSDRTTELLDSLPRATSARLGFKIGGHFGTVVASRMGGETQQHIAVTGDTVNIASRLMEVAASHGAAFAVSGELLSAAGEDCEVRRVGSLRGPVESRLRGRTASMDVWLWSKAQASNGDESASGSD